jgi:hypothetical protein
MITELSNLAKNKRGISPDPAIRAIAADMKYLRNGVHHGYMGRQHFTDPLKQKILGLIRRHVGGGRWFNCYSEIFPAFPEIKLISSILNKAIAGSGKSTNVS